MNKTLKYVLVFLSGIVCYFIFSTILAMMLNKGINTQPLLWALFFGFAFSIGLAIVDYFKKKKL